MSTESQLREKLRKIEALFAGAGTTGERLAAEAALERVRARLTELGHKEVAEVKRHPSFRSCQFSYPLSFRGQVCETKGPLPCFSSTILFS